MNEWREGFHLMLTKPCAGHRLQSDTQPTSQDLTAQCSPWLEASAAVQMDLGLIVGFSCPLPPPPSLPVPLY